MPLCDDSRPDRADKDSILFWKLLEANDSQLESCWLSLSAKTDLVLVHVAIVLRLIGKSTAVKRYTESMDGERYGLHMFNYLPAAKHI